MHEQNIGCPWVVYQRYCIQLGEYWVSRRRMQYSPSWMQYIWYTTKESQYYNYYTRSTPKTLYKMRQRKREIQYYHNYFRSQQLFWKPTSIGNNRICVVTMQRVRISSYAQKVGVVLARRAIRIVNKIHDVTMYNISSQSNALTTLDSCAWVYVHRKNGVNIARKSRSELNILTILNANFTLAERRKTRTECK